MDDTQPGWYPDPSNRHERRYWTGARWSRHVIDRGVRGVDPEGASRIPGRRPMGEPSEAGPTTYTTPEPTGRRLRRGPSFVAVVAIGAVLGTLLGALFIVAGADSGSGGGGQKGNQPDTSTAAERDEYVDALVANITATAGDGTLGAEQVDCVAQRIVDLVGLERLAQLDILNVPETMSQEPLVVGDKAQATYREAFGCLDDQSLVAFLAATVQRSTAMTPDQARCTLQGWFDGMGRDALVDMYANLSTEWAGAQTTATAPPEYRDVIIHAASECAPPPAPPS